MTTNEAITVPDDKVPSAVLYLYDDGTDDQRYYYGFEYTTPNDGTDPAITAAQAVLGGIIHAIRTNKISELVDDFEDWAATQVTE